MSAALDSMRAAMPAPSQAADNSDATLAALAQSAPDDPAPDTSVEDALGTLTPPPEEEEIDAHADALDALKTVPVVDEVEADDTADILAGIERVEVEDAPDRTDAILSGLEPAPEDAPDTAHADALASIDTSIADAPSEEEDVSAILDGIEPVAAAPDTEAEMDDILSTVEVVNTPEDEGSAIDDALSSIDTSAPDATGEDDTSVDDVLSGIEAPPEAESSPDISDTLASIEVIARDEPPEDDVADILNTIETIESTDDDPSQSIDAALGTVDTSVADTGAPQDTALDDALSSIDTSSPVEAEDTTIEDALASVDVTAPVESEENTLDDVLDGIEAVEMPDETGPVVDDILADLDEVDASDQPEDNLNDVLSAIETSPDAEAEDTSIDDALASLDAVDAEEDSDSVDDILGTLEIAEEEEAPDTEIDDALGSLEPVTETDVMQDSIEDVLGTIEASDDVTPNAQEDLDSILDTLETPAEEAEDEDETLDDILGSIEATETPEEDTSLDDALASVDTAEPVEATQDDEDLDALLAGLDAPEDTADDDTDVDDILAGLDEPEDATEAAAEDNLDDILAELDAAPEEEDGDDLDALLNDLSDDADTPNDGTVSADDDLDALLSDLDDDSESVVAEDSADEEDLDSLLAELDDDASAADDLDAMLADLDADEDTEGASAPDLADPSEEEDLDSLLAVLDDDTGAEDVDLDAMLAGLDSDEEDAEADDLDALLADLDDEEEDQDEAVADDDGADPVAAAPAAPKPKPQSPFGRISAPRPERENLHRPKFRMAVFGDFTGRAARGLMETGAELAARKPIELDVDTVEDVIESFATTLTLPIGKGGAGIEVKLSELDDLHPDELYEKVALFEALTGLRQQLSVGSMADKATEKLKAWSEEFATPVKLPKTSASTSVPSNLKLSDFQSLIGDTSGRLTQASPAEDLIAQVVGPHIVKAPDAGAAAMQKAVDEALSTAMRLVLHHPDFQAVEAQWRSLDFLARRIETDSDLQIVLYDVSAEELAADLAASEDLGDSGLFKLLTDVLDPEEGAGGFSAMFGLYTFEETPPHAELLARIGQIGAHVDAPFFAAMTPNYLDVPKEERHPLVAETWDKLRELPEAEYIGLASPRFLLRLPYGAKTDPTYEFDFEEFTPKEGLSGMLWANPVVAVAVLLAATRKKDGKAMDLGSLMSLGDLPFHYVTDRFGDQVALPCTERNLTSDPAQATLARGFMPLVWIKGRNEVRLGSFRALGGDEILGPWAGEVPPPRLMPGRPNAEVELDTTLSAAEDDVSDADDLDLSFDEDEDSSDDLDMSFDDDEISMDDLDLSFDDDSESDLDDLLASFDDDEDDDESSSGEDDDEMDPELAALLEGL
ncbi:MAG: type VI secretion system contractile sheath large subunit [Pseudomonadota bacterium]